MNLYKTYKIIQADLNPYLAKMSLRGLSLNEEDLLVDFELDQGPLVGADLSRVAFKSVKFTNVVFEGTSFYRGDFTHVVFEGCDLSNVDLSNAVFDKCTFKSCKLIGTNLSESGFSDVVFEGCNLQYANFRFTRHKNVAFYESKLTLMEMKNSNLSKCHFIKCEMDQMLFYGTPLRGIDLRGNTFVKMDLTLDDLRGAIITPDQGMSFLGLLGVEIKYD